jgi:phage repressor protein C with HTH and peptisase S24 domain
MGKILSRVQEIANNESITLTALERTIGASKGVISRAINNGTDIQSKWIELIVENYPLYSTEWLITGNGPMIKSNQGNKVPFISDNTIVGVPYYDVDFIAGFDCVYNNQTSVPYTNIVFSPFANATLWCNVTGHSMEPEINNGDIIAMKEQNVEDILYGEMYAVVLDNFRTIKILRKGSKPNMLKFVPINKEYDDQEFSIDRILKIYAVMGSIRKFF